MQKDFLEFIKKHALIENVETTLLAVSGGIDSVVMVHLFHECGFPFAIAHCNFQLRGDDSKMDEEFVIELARRFNVQCHIKSFDTADYSKNRGISIQMAARELRYSWFDEICNEFGYHKLATAHHLNDNVETVVGNLVRGTSISGLRGMLPGKSRLIRPLLKIPRDQIESFAESQQIRWREDSSNKTDDYKRNFIRHHILPEFEKINPNYLEVIETSREKNEEVERVFEDYLEKIRKEVYMDETSLSIDKLKSNGVGPYVLSKLLKVHGFNYDQSKSILSSLNGGIGNVFLSQEFVLTVDRDYLYIDEREDSSNKRALIEQGSTKLETSNRFSFHRTKDLKINRDENQAFLDYDKLKFPLEVRTWEQGDYFVPLGMKGKKKLSDFMIDTKIPLNLKQRQEVVISNGEIVWVVGKRIDDRFKVTNETKDVFLITLEEEHV